MYLNKWEIGSKAVSVSKSSYKICIMYTFGNNGNTGKMSANFLKREIDF